jgi:DNA-binding transcriptional regulator YdaS (Cro superfamily)
MDQQGNTPESAVARAVRILDGSVNAARRLGVERYQSVQSWVREGRVPAPYAPAVAEATGVPVWELRPDDWHRIWPMLIGTDGAPEVPAAAEKKAA